MYDENNLSESLREKYTDENGNLDRERLKNDLKNGEKFVFRIHLFCSMIFIIAGLVFAVVGSVKLCSSLRDKKVCTVCTEGEVTSFQSKRSDISDDNSDIIYAPVFTYEYKGEKYTYSGSSYSDDTNLFVGKRVKVYVDPNDGSHVYIPDYKAEMKNTIAFIIFGLCIAGGFIAYCFYQKREFTRDFNRLTNNETNN